MQRNRFLSYFLTLFVSFLLPAVVSAHVGMLNSNPVENGIVSPELKIVTVKFAGEVEPAFSKIEVLNPEGKKISKKTKFSNDNKVLETKLKGKLSPGIYTVKWKCMSLDGHTLSGEYTFTVE